MTTPIFGYYLDESKGICYRDSARASVNTAIELTPAAELKKDGSFSSIVTSKMTQVLRRRDHSGQPEREGQGWIRDKDLKKVSKMLWADFLATGEFTTTFSL